MAMVREGCPVLGHGLCEKGLGVLGVIVTAWFRGLTGYVHRVITAILHAWFFNIRK